MLSEATPQRVLDSGGDDAGLSTLKRGVLERIKGLTGVKKGVK